MAERKPIISEKPIITSILKARKPLLFPNVRSAFLDVLDDLLTRMRKPATLAEVATYILTRGITPLVRERLTDVFSGRRPLLERLLGKG